MFDVVPTEFGGTFPNLNVTATNLIISSYSTSVQSWRETSYFAYNIKRTALAVGLE